MTEKKLKPYKGLLSPKEVAAGMNVAIQNGKRLAEDAQLLLDNDRLATATSIAALSIEESGKVAILRQLALATSQKEAADTWKRYRRHTEKNKLWLFPQLVAKGARHLEDFQSLASDHAEHPKQLNQLKQLGLYTDCYQHGHWSSPEKVISKDLTESLVYNTQVLASKKSVTEKEIKLWIKHLRPVKGQSQEWVEQAVINWYDEMKKSGLAPLDDEKFREFIGDGSARWL